MRKPEQHESKAPPPRGSSLAEEMDAAFGSGIDPQFAGIFVGVAIVCISLVAHARNQIWVTPEEAIDVKRLTTDAGWLPTPKAPPPGLFAPDGTAPASSKTPRPGPVTRHGAGAGGSARARTASPRSAGRLGVLGALDRARSGDVVDVFADGDLAPTLAGAFTEIRGVDLATAPAVHLREDTDRSSAGIGDLSSHAERLALALPEQGDTALAGRPDITVIPPPDGGERSVDGITAVLRAHLGALRECYEHGLKRDRTLAGKLVLRLEISADGDPCGVSVDQDTFRSPDVAACIVHRAQHWRFPRASGDTVSVSYPLVFTHAD